ncbi:MAG: cytochrome c peroxidase [Planctomycetota bacterium]
MLHTHAKVTFGILLTAACGWHRDAAAQFVPDLPETPYNYSQITLPQHFSVNAFPANLPQNAVTDNDNTPADNPITDAGATLGRVLFYERKLSANETVACATCHQQEFAFTDPLALSVGFEGGTTRRRSMSLINARFYESGKFFWDERADTLEDQVLEPIQDHVEMGLTLEELVTVVESQDYYPDLFTDAFGDSEVTTDRISRALAQFVRSIVSYRSKYDEGRAQVNSPLAPFPNFTQEENAGKNLFMRPVPNTQASCVTCHMSEAFITPARFNAPPNVISDATNNGLDPVSTIDFGVLEATGNQADDFKFKVPSLRNVAVRPPYMHDGRFTSLQQVIGFYSGGIRNHPNLHPILRGPNGQPVRFNFNAQQRDAMVAFLETLTDEDVMSEDMYSDPFVFVPPPPLVEGFLINAGDPQRSLVTEVSVFFDQEVTAEDSAFSILDRETGDSVEGLIVQREVLEGKTVVHLTFSEDAHVILRDNGAHSLIDGNYQLDIRAVDVTAIDSGPAMERDVSFGTIEDDQFFCLFGDSDGDRDVDGVNYGHFSQTFFRSAPDPNYNEIFDYDGDDDVDGQDFGNFLARWMMTMPFSSGSLSFGL